jgi:hypothetical protein
VAQYFGAWRTGDEARLVELLDDQVAASGPLVTVHGAVAHARSLARSSPMFEDIAVEQMVGHGEIVMSWFKLVLVGGEEVLALAGRATACSSSAIPDL